MSFKISEIAFSCYAVTDVARARRFYEGVLGLTPARTFGEEGKGQWVEYDIGPGTLALGGGSPDWQPSPDGCSVALEVDDFDAAVAAVRAAGVKFRIEPMKTPVCQMAGIHDPDGNTLMIHRRNGTSWPTQ